MRQVVRHRDIQFEERQRHEVRLQGRFIRDRSREEPLPRQGPLRIRCGGDQAAHHTQLYRSVRCLQEAGVQQGLPHMPQRNTPGCGGGRQQDLRYPRTQACGEEPLHRGADQPAEELRVHGVQRCPERRQRFDHPEVQGHVLQEALRGEEEAPAHQVVRCVRGVQGAVDLLSQDIQRGEAAGVHLRVLRHSRGGPDVIRQDDVAESELLHRKGRRYRVPGGPTWTTSPRWVRTCRTY